jgi:lysyl-tRNA synthetase class 2
MTPDIVALRHQLLKYTRQYFWKNGFLEIDTPVLQKSLPLEPNIYPFITKWSQSPANLYLSTSPESTLKKTFSTLNKPLFSISKSFRNLESASPHHQPEFTMLEWYNPDTDYTQTISQLQKYLSFIFKKFNFSFSLKSEIIPLTKLFSLYAHTSLPDNEPDLNQIFLNQIEPKLSKHPYLFITDYPAFMSPLAQKNPQNPKLTFRFELYLNGIEIANGCTENRNSADISNSFLKEKQLRLSQKLPLSKIDSDFAKISAQIPPSSGCGLGLDRLLLLLSGQKSLNQVTFLNL